MIAELCIAPGDGGRTLLLQVAAQICFCPRQRLRTTTAPAGTAAQPVQLEMCFCLGRKFQNHLGQWHVAAHHAADAICKAPVGVDLLMS